MDLLNGPSFYLQLGCHQEREKEAELFFAAQRSKLQPKGKLREEKNGTTKPQI